MSPRGPAPDHPGDPATTVRAAGGVVWRAVAGELDGDGSVQVVVVHRPRYDDWSLPKGKLDPGETFEDAAVREVQEETGVVAELGDELPAVTYSDHKGRPKVVRYWSMPVRAEGDFEPNDEVDELRWVGLDEAHRLLSYDTDHRTLEAFVGRRRRS